MSQCHRDDPGIVECGDNSSCASLQQSAEELAPMQLCSSRGIWFVIERTASARRIGSSASTTRADVSVRPCREQSTRTRAAFHQDIDTTGPQSLHTAESRPPASCRAHCP